MTDRLDNVIPVENECRHTEAMPGAHGAVMAGPGGCVECCPWLKAVLVRPAAFIHYCRARLSTRDPTRGFRLFSRLGFDRITIESDNGFCYAFAATYLRLPARGVKLRSSWNCAT